MFTPVQPHMVNIYYVFGANSFPKVTDLICRLPLPTLFYRLEAMNLENLMRFRYGYVIRKGIHHVFTGHVQELG